MKTKSQYDNPAPGCYIDENAGSANDCNERTIKFAESCGFDAGLLSGCFDGLRGLSIEMSLDDALSASHSGSCDDDVACLVSKPEIAAQLDKFGVDEIRAGLKESGAWDAEELDNVESNRERAVWIAACDIRENKSETLDELANEAVEFLNDQEHRTAMFWTFEDNSLFLIADVDSAREQVEFISSSKQDYPPDDYRGEWLHVSDHGNATLYNRGEDGKDVEIWSFV